MARIAQDSTLQALLDFLKSENSVLTSNCTNRPLTVGEYFIGNPTDVSKHNSIVFACKSDKECVLYLEFSVDGENWDSSLSYTIQASVNEVHRITVTRQFFRVRVYNNGSAPQQYLRLQCIGGDFTQLTSPLGSLIQTDQDTIVVRPLDFNLMVAEGLYQNRSNTIKDGINPDVRSGSVPEDVWYSGGTYTGFPTGAIEAAEMVVAGADTGTVYYSYLESETSLDYVFGSKAIAGAGTYALGHNIWRCNFAYFVGSSATAFNAGNITIRNTPTTTNIFVTIPAGYSQSYVAAYTVPYGSTIYIDRITAVVRGSTSASLDGFFWYRTYGESPRLRFPFEVQFGQLYFDDIDYLVRIPERVDIIPRITGSTSASAVEIEVSYRFIKVKG